jgi:hypothetical protein
MEGWFGIECPFVNFPSLDNADFEKFQESPIPSSASVPFTRQDSGGTSFICTEFPAKTPVGSAPVFFKVQARMLGAADQTFLFTGDMAHPDAQKEYRPKPGEVQRCGPLILILMSGPAEARPLIPRSWTSHLP